MARKTIETKGERKPWMIKNFPVHLRLQVKHKAEDNGKTVPEFMEEVLKGVLKNDR